MEPVGGIGLGRATSSDVIDSRSGSKPTGKLNHAESGCDLALGDVGGAVLAHALAIIPIREAFMHSFIRVVETWGPSPDGSLLEFAQGLYDMAPGFGTVSRAMCFGRGEGLPALMPPRSPHASALALWPLTSAGQVNKVLVLAL